MSRAPRARAGDVPAALPSDPAPVASEPAGPRAPARRSAGKAVAPAPSVPSPVGSPPAVGTPAVGTPAAGTSAVTTPAVRIEDPLALFVPERHLIGSVPLPLYLLELVPGSVKADYERTATGMVAQEADRIRRRTVRYPGGVRVDIEVHGDQVRGLPTTFDYDYFLALCRIADEGGVDGQGYFVDPGYRAVLRAAGRSDDAIGGEQVEAVKRAFARFGGLILYTRLDVDYSQASGQVRSGARHPLVPDGAPPVREREGKHWVLEYDVEAERRHGASYDSIERLRINPLWLDQAAAGIAAWMDVGLHNALRSGYAKRLLQLFTVRAARGWRVLDPWVLDLRELYEALEVPPTQWGKTQTRTGVSQALATLADQGVLGQGDVVKHGKGRYEVTLVAGERLLAAGYQRGTGAADGIADRMLLWHLRALGYSAAQARELVRSKPDQVRTVLRRVYYLQAVKGGLSNGRPVEDWTAWTRAAIEQEYAFSDPEWQRWLTAQLEAGARGEWLPGRPTLPARADRAPATRRVMVTAVDPAAQEGREGAEPDATAAEGRTPHFADDLWGQALERFVAAAPEHSRVYDTWLARTALDGITETEVIVTAEDSFAAEWIAQKYRDPLASFVSAVAGRPLALQVRAQGAAAPTTSPETPPESQPDLFGGPATGR